VRPLAILRCIVIVVGAHFLSVFVAWPLWMAVRPLAFPMPRKYIFPTEVVSLGALIPATVAGAIAGIVVALCLDREAGREWALITAAFVGVMAALSFRWGHPNAAPPEILIPWLLKVVLSAVAAAVAFLLSRKRGTSLQAH
jgi:nitrate/nitrite transporter NarK